MNDVLVLYCDAFLSEGCKSHWSAIEKTTSHYDIIEGRMFWYVLKETSQKIPFLANRGFNMTHLVSSHVCCSPVFPMSEITSLNHLTKTSSLSSSCNQDKSEPWQGAFKAAASRWLWIFMHLGLTRGFMFPCRKAGVPAFSSWARIWSCKC